MRLREGEEGGDLLQDVHGAQYDVIEAEEEEGRAWEGLQPSAEV